MATTSTFGYSYLPSAALGGPSDQDNLILIDEDLAAEHNSDGTHGNTKRMRVQVVADATAKTAIATPVEGQVVFQSSSDEFYAYDGAAWELIGGGNGALPIDLFAETENLSTNAADAYAAGLAFTPGYTTSGTAVGTVTRHNYFNLSNVTAAGSAAVTDAAVFRFNAAPGTHLALAAGTTKGTPNAVDAFVKINIAGTLYYMPAYLSMTD